MGQEYDVIVAGGGLSGVLATVKILSALPDAKILLLEKENFLGGRLRSTDPKLSKWSFGINAVSPELCDYIESNVGLVLPEFDSGPYKLQTVEKFGQLSASKLSIFEKEQVLSSESGRIMGGKNAGAELAELDNILADEQTKPSDQKLAKIIDLKRKSPGAVVLGHQAMAFGVPDVWESDVEHLRARAKTYRSGLIAAKWDEFCEDVLDCLTKKYNVDYFKSCHIISGAKEEDIFHLKTEKGKFSGLSLVVAQNPWAAHRWLDVNLFSDSLIKLVLKSKPVSLVTLSFANESCQELPDMTMIPAEKAQVFSFENSLTFQATIDYELSLASLEVVKAVKRLRRARKRFEAYFDDVDLNGEFVALLPCAWPLPVGYADAKLIKGLKSQSVNGPGVQFCGDSYGVDLDGDQNIMASVSCGARSAVALVNELRQKGSVNEPDHRRQKAIQSDQTENKI